MGREKAAAEDGAARGEWRWEDVVGREYMARLAREGILSFEARKRDKEECTRWVEMAPCDARRRGLDGDEGELETDWAAEQVDGKK